MSEWKPGDVALVQMGDGPTLAIFTGEFWAWSDGNGPFEGVSHCHRSVPAHRAVVIDPEDREQVERLADAYLVANSNVASMPVVIADRLQAALREFAEPTPPKPDEPMGLGAVVKATCDCRSEAQMFVRDPAARDFNLPHDARGVARGDEVPWVASCGHHRWSDLRVEQEALSHGVTDDAGGAS